MVMVVLNGMIGLDPLSAFCGCCWLRGSSDYDGCSGGGGYVTDAHYQLKGLSEREGERLSSVTGQ